MIERELPPMAPYQSGEIQNLGKRQPPENNPVTQDIQVGVVNRQGQVQQQTEDFENYLNGNQVTTVLANNTPPSNTFDPAAEIARNSALQGYGALGQNQAV
ncbi:hypothetical protein [Rhizobium alvei]|uniref:Uncharacterized protein n=1 Tax=Rhizobium alvei TaxID=1132659 RepID=A0ABT8YS52_9HYPH|nr:hypothetical protein [Rhizobium alvei]MDO6966483.1 hypothetical protein [Rhizobium alvei]